MRTETRTVVLTTTIIGLVAGEAYHLGDAGVATLRGLFTYILEGGYLDQTEALLRHLATLEAGQTPEVSL